MTSKLAKQGIKFFKAGDKQKAQHIFKEAIKSNPQDETAWFWLAATYKKRANQIKCLRKLLAINPQHEAARQQLARLTGRQYTAPTSSPQATSDVLAEEVSLPNTDTPQESDSQGLLPPQTPTNWTRIGLTGLGIFSLLAVFGAILFGSNLFSTTGLSNILSGPEDAPLVNESAIPGAALITPTAGSPSAEVLPLSLTTSPKASRTPAPAKTRVLNLPAPPPITTLFPCLPQNTERIQAKVIRVVDGDTVDIEYNGKQYSVRYIGIDAPETGHGGVPREYFSEDATSRNTDLMEDQLVTLVKDISNTDQYGRLLRYVLIDDVFINHILVNEGYALSATFPPDIACANLFDEAQESARLNNKGLWKNIPLNSKTTTPVAGTPTPQTAITCPFGCKEHYAGCDIKGNINIEGEKIYHLPGSEWYDGTIINTSQGERWFCTAEEAENNGWRAAK